MVSIAWKNLTHERGRFAISIGGVAFAVLLVLVLGSLYQGWNTRIASYIRSVGADLWVAQLGSADMSHSVSLLPSDLAPTLEAVPGVKSVYPFIGRQIAFPFQGDDVHIFLVGYDAAGSIGRPVKMVKGQSTPTGRELIIDRVLAQKYDLAIGDRLGIIKGEEWTIVGIAEGGNQIVYTYAFANLDAVRDVLKMEGRTNYFLVVTETGRDVMAVKRDLEATATVQATPREEFVTVNKRIISETFLPIIGILVLIAFGIGAAVVGLTIYTATVEKEREYGVLKAIGFTNGKLYRIVLVQSLIAAALGYLAGLAIVFPLVALVEKFEPSFVTAFTVRNIVLVFGMTLVIAIAAAWAPTRRLAHLDPAIVFKA